MASEDDDNIYKLFKSARFIWDWAKSWYDSGIFQTVLNSAVFLSVGGFCKKHLDEPSSMQVAAGAVIGTVIQASISKYYHVKELREIERAHDVKVGEMKSKCHK
jgi:hypothetical protein